MRNRESHLFCKNQLNSITVRTWAGFLENPNPGQKNLSSRYVLQAVWGSGTVRLPSPWQSGVSGILRLGEREVGSTRWKEGIPGADRVL